MEVLNTTAASPWQEFKGMIRYKRVQTLSSMGLIIWAIALLEPTASASALVIFQYMPWPWRAIVYGIVGLGWPVTTLMFSEVKARNWLLLQGSFHMGTSFHLFLGYLRGETLITGVVIYMAISLYVISDWLTTPKTLN